MIYFALIYDRIAAWSYSENFLQSLT